MFKKIVLKKRMSQEELDNILEVIELLEEDRELLEKGVERLDKRLDFVLHAACIEFEDNPKPFPSIHENTRDKIRMVVDEWYKFSEYVKEKEVCH